MIIPGANHVDLYDRLDKIPLDKIADFFGQHLASPQTADTNAPECVSA
jgi:hypothetical protein